MKIAWAKVARRLNRVQSFAAYAHKNDLFRAKL